MSAGMRLAKASKDDIRKMLRFVQLIEQIVALDVDADKIKRIVMRQYPRLCRGWIRIICGCDMLIENCCDPQLSYLDWRPDIKKFLEQPTRCQNGDHSAPDV